MHKRFLVLSLLILALLSLSACGLLREPEAASGPLEAIPVESTSPAATATAANPAPEATEPAAEPASEATEPVAEPEAVEEPAAAADTEANAETEAAPAGQARRYQILQDQSQVRFELDEDLRGQRITVVGTTDQVAGEIVLDLNDLASTQLGIIQVNARTLLTDNNFRNRAIQNEILDTGSFELISFTPTGISGLSGPATLGEPVTFSVEGDLTIRDITLPATFEVTATPVSEGEITGSASTIVNREDFGLAIPSVPNVANVEEEVELYIDFVAREQP